MRCSKCGARLRKKDLYCSQCGASTPGNPDRPFRDTFLEEREEGSRALMTTITALMFIVMAVALGVTIYMFRPKWESLRFWRQDQGEQIEIVTELQNARLEAEKLPEEQAKKELADLPVYQMNAEDTEKQAAGLAESSGPSAETQSAASPGAENAAQSADGSIGAENAAQPADGSAGAENTGQPADGSAGAGNTGSPADASAGAENTGQLADTSTLAENAALSEGTSSGGGSETQPAAAGSSGTGMETQPQETEESSSASTAPEGAVFETEGGTAEESSTETVALQEETQVRETEEEDVTPIGELSGSRIEEILQMYSTAADTGIYVYDLAGNREFSYGSAGQGMYASAAITVPILYTAASLLDAGVLTLNDQIVYVNSIGGRGEPYPEQRDGVAYPLTYYLTTMLSYSDNNCMNCLIDLLTLERINSVCRAAGFTQVDLQRKIVADVTDGTENYVSARDLVLMTKELYNGKFRTIGREFMQRYFRMDLYDEAGSVIGQASQIAARRQQIDLLTQNGRGDTRFCEVALLRDGDSTFAVGIMMRGEVGFAYEEAVKALADYIYTALGPQQGNPAAGETVPETIPMTPAFQGFPGIIPGTQTAGYAG